MQTLLRQVDEDSLALAARLIRAGELVAFPTETVYGLGGNALDEAAVLKIFAAKDRPADNPLIVHLYDIAQADALCRFTGAAEKLARVFWPGPLTMLLEKHKSVPAVVTAGLNTLALRLPSHAGAQRFLRRCGLPVAAPSANRSGKPSPTSARHVWDDLQGRIPLILDGGDCEVGLESTVLDLSGERPVILRPGAVTREQIISVLGACDLAPSIMRPLREGEDARSPGMRHRHYAPKARLSLVQGEPEQVAHTIRQLYDSQPKACILAMHGHLPEYGQRAVLDLGQDAAEAAHRLFGLLRQCDALGVEQIYCECLPREGMGLAVMNRLARAAEFDIIQAVV